MNLLEMVILLSLFVVVHIFGILFLFGGDEVGCEDEEEGWDGCKDGDDEAPP